ncbi:BACON domain-containing carbohydrate-binding protein [uncultured Parabacteroides sp.]|uniref:BACON domain-containing protein n=1 Tax=uncultured Parabacteroides sp. TaxID=512312 RepID=UPI00259BF1C9|nr:BACON domain-containing carbohydrate-binding protein [uncultured Parabacteroides sp.]
MERVNKIERFAWLILLLAGSCTLADVGEEDSAWQALKEVDAGFHLHVEACRTAVTRSLRCTAEGTVDSDTLAVGENDRMDTRAANPLADGLENRISAIWVGQYDASTGALLFCKYIDSFSGDQVNVKLKKSQDETESRVWFVANAGDLGRIETEADLKKHVLSYASTENGLPTSNLCEMAGFWQGIVEENGVKDVEVKLTRLLAKIEFTYSMGGDSFTFIPTSVALCSVPQKMQVDASESQLKEMSYITYTGEVDEQGTTMYWYLPENMAGTVSDEYTVDSEKKKTGQGVSDATFIKLTGTAVQSGVTYENVTFCFYPGQDKNNYDIVRNSYYKMNVTLVGIDISDERITVGKIPPIVVTGGNMPAEKGGRTEVQITARPGQEWSFELEEWLSAIVEGKVVGTGVGVSYQGPANVVFEALSSNPKAEDRSVSFSVDVNGQLQEIALTQAGSTLTTGGDLSLGAAAGSEASSYFTATKGLSWLAAVSGENWWKWSGDNQGGADKETTGEQQALNVKVISSNPLAEERTGTVTVKVGASVGNPDYHNLTKEITVRQAASTVKGSTVELEPVAATGQSSSFTATSGLPWAAEVTNGDWITLAGSTGGDQTMGSAQMITFDVKVNPNASQRSGAITVRAGEEDGGPTGTITVKQKASSLMVSGDKTTLAATADDSGTLTYKATKGLSLSIAVPDWLILTATPSDNTSGEKETLGYKTSSLNLNSADKTGNISVTAGGMTTNVAIRQAASTFSVTGPTTQIANTGGSVTGSVTATTGLPWTINPDTDNGITVKPTSGTGDAPLTFTASDNTGGERSGTFLVAVTGAPGRTTSVTVTQTAKETGVYLDNFQICKTDNNGGHSSTWYSANLYCEELETEGQSDWRLPSRDELSIVAQNLLTLNEIDGFTDLSTQWHWTNTPGSGGYHWLVLLGNGQLYQMPDGSNQYWFRCVRSVTSQLNE